MRCDFVKFSDSTQDLTMQFGIWRYRAWTKVTNVDGTFFLETCHGYPSAMPVDASWRAARTFSSLTNACILLIVVGYCVSRGARSAGWVTAVWKAPAYLLTALCQFLVLLLLDSDVCKANGLVNTLDPLMENATFP